MQLLRLGQRRSATSDDLRVEGFKTPPTPPAILQRSAKRERIDLTEGLEEMPPPCTLV